MSNYSQSYSAERAEEEMARRLHAERSFLSFVTYTKPDYSVNWHHRLLAQYLQDFADGKIKKLMVFMPPQHGKSELVSRRLPAYLLGKNPNLRIIGCSYSADLATSFNRDVQRIIDDRAYANVWPDTRLNSSNVKTSAKGSYLRNSDIFEVVGHRGFYKSVGLGGSLTGTPADIGIIDDPVKDAVEADSPTYRARAWDWFTNVFSTRLHNDSQILVTQTRWHEDDLSGRILRKLDGWQVLSLPAICNGEKHPEDPRKHGEALWPEKHSLERLREIQQSNERSFHALYQQDPKPFEGGLVFSEWQTGWEENAKPLAWGLDFGFDPDPVALIEVREAGHALYFRQHIYRQRMNPDDIREAVKAIVPRGEPVFCDHRTDLIDLLYRDGVNAKPAIKTEIDTGVKLMQARKLFIHPDSADLIREIKLYKYAEDKDGNPIGGKFAKSPDHALDAARYGYASTVLQKSNKIRTFGVM